MSIIVSSVAKRRPNVISYAIDGGTDVNLLDKLGNTDGAEWDTYIFDVTIPAGATALRVQLHSRDGNVPLTGLDPASMNWLTCAFRLGQPTSQGGEGCTPGFWKSPTWSKIWDGLGTDDVTTTIKTTSLFNATLGVTASQSGLADTATLLDAVMLGGGHLKALARHCAAGLANADASTVNYPMSLSEVIALYRSVVVSQTMDWEKAKDILVAANELGCDPK